jgi:hypothetical protein
MTQTSEETNTPRRRLRLSFSLRSLLICTLLAGACMSAYFRWEPWTRVGTSPFGTRKFSSDLRRALLNYSLVSDPGYRVVVQEVDSGRVVMPELKLDDNVDKVEISPNGRCLVFFGRWGRKCALLKLERPEERNEIQLPLALRLPYVYPEFSPDSNLLSINRTDALSERLDIYNVALKKFVLNIEGGQLRGFSPNSNLMLLETNDGMVVYRSTGEKLCERKLDYQIRSNVFTPDLAKLILAGTDAKVHILSVGDAREIDAFACPVAQAQHPFFTADGRYCVTGSDKEFTVWDVTLRKPVCSYSCYVSLLHGNSDGVPRVITRDLNKAYILSAVDQLKLGEFSVKPDNRASPFEMPKDYNPPPSTTQTSPDGRRIVLAADAGYEIFERCRPELFFGLRYPPECWLAGALFLALCFSLRGDWRLKRVP